MRTLSPQRLTIFFLALLTTLVLGGCEKPPSLHLGTTTTLEDSGLLKELTTAFKKETGIEIKPIIAGSGKIHRLLENGDVDTAITHDPTGEKNLFENKLILEPEPLFQNSFVIVGPKADPAHVHLSLNPEEVFKKIMNHDMLFISRGDDSGTYQMEKYWWQQAKITPKANLYISTGTGMGETLAVAVERNAYTLVDRGTWENYGNTQSLDILFDDDYFLPNIYSLLSLSNKEAIKDAPSLERWEAWIKSETAKSLIDSYRINNKHIYSYVKN